MEYTLKGIRYRIALPSLPLVAAEVCNLVADEKVGCKAVGEAVAGDPAIAASVLRLANSPLYCRRGRVSSIEEAATMMGSKAIQNLVVQVSLLKVCSRMGAEIEAEMSRYWRHSMAAAVFADALARASSLPGAPSPEDAYTCGLLHDLGELVLLDNLGANYARLLSFARSRAVPQEELERELLSVDHASVGACAMSEWNLPGPLQLAAERHHSSEALGGDDLPLVVLTAADRLAEALGGARVLNREAAGDAVTPELEARLGLREGWAAEMISASGRLQSLGRSTAA